jgi:hypothetical protein
MAKKKTDDEALNEMIAKESNPEHFKPMEDPKGPPVRPALADPSHAKPMAEVKEESRKVKVSDPSHLKPQE